MSPFCISTTSTVVLMRKLGMDEFFGVPRTCHSLELGPHTQIQPPHKVRLRLENSESETVRHLLQAFRVHPAWNPSWLTPLTLKAHFRTNTNPHRSSTLDSMLPSYRGHSGKCFLIGDVAIITHWMRITSTTGITPLLGTQFQNDALIDTLTADEEGSNSRHDQTYAPGLRTNVPDGIILPHNLVRVEFDADRIQAHHQDS
jgi:hypothetical protein